MTPWLTTDRLELWRPVPADADRVFAIHSDPETYRHHPEGRMTARAQADQRLGEWLADWQRHGFGYACVRRRGDPEVIGFAGVKPHTALDVPVLNIYYRFDPAAWGHGYAYEAVRAVLDATAGGVPFLARVATANPASIRLAERLGLALQPEHDPLDPVPHHLFSSAPLAP